MADRHGVRRGRPGSWYPRSEQRGAGSRAESGNEYGVSGTCTNKQLNTQKRLDPQIGHAHLCSTVSQSPLGLGISTSAGHCTRCLGPLRSACTVARTVRTVCTRYVLTPAPTHTRPLLVHRGAYRARTARARPSCPLGTAPCTRQPSSAPTRLINDKLLLSLVATSPREKRVTRGRQLRSTVPAAH